LVCPELLAALPSSHGGQTCPSSLLLPLLALELPPRTVLPPRVTAGAGAGSSFAAAERSHSGSSSAGASSSVLDDAASLSRCERASGEEALPSLSRCGGDVDFLVGAVGGGAAGGTATGGGAAGGGAAGGGAAGGAAAGGGGRAGGGAAGDRGFAPSGDITESRLRAFAAISA